MGLVAPLTAFRLATPLDFTAITDITIKANRPDLILVLKKTGQALMIDFSYPLDFNVAHMAVEKD